MAIGTSIVLNESTRQRAFAHYARLLIDFDLAGTFPSEVMVESGRKISVQNTLSGKKIESILDLAYTTIQKNQMNTSQDMR